MSILKEALGRIDSQQEQVLDLLKDRGTDGAYNHELAKYAMSYQRRVHELVEQGYNIKVTNEGGGNFKYTLVGMLSPSERNRKPILEQIVREIEDKHNGSIDALELLDIIDNVGAMVSYKGVAKAKKEVTA